jgi:Cu/Ag efflux protein CusF
MDLRTLTVACAALLAGNTLVSAHQTTTKMGNSVKKTVTIQQIDTTGRFITFKNDDGTEDTVWASPDVKRFDELKVGDKVNLSYYESTVYQVRKPGDPPLTPGSSTATTGTSGTLPGGTSARQTVKTVTVKAVDPTAGTITVTTNDGHSVIRKVEDKTKLTGVQPGDKIDIVYTEAVLISVERPQ